VGPVQAEADFTLTSNTITITLTNFLRSGTKPQQGNSGQMADSQLISGITFNVTGPSGTNTASLSASDGKTFSITSAAQDSTYTLLTDTHPLGH
jgi:hypothetical protein